MRALIPLAAEISRGSMVRCLSRRNVATAVPFAQTSSIQTDTRNETELERQDSADPRPPAILWRRYSR